MFDMLFGKESGLFKVTEKIHSFFGGKWLPFGFSAVVVNDLVDTDSDIAALALFLDTLASLDFKFGN